LKRIISAALAVLMSFTFVSAAFATGETETQTAVTLTASSEDIMDAGQEQEAESEVMVEAVENEELRVDYMAEMIAAAVLGDYEKGVAAQNARNAKIDSLKLNVQKIYFEDLYLLGKIMYAEAGSYWLSDEWKMCVGEVVLNRVASPEFPDTIYDVLIQKGQYYGANSRYFTWLRPTELCVKLALRLLQGERVMNDPAVVFQANFRQGSGTHTAYYDRYLGATYFCYSMKMYLYES